MALIVPARGTVPAVVLPLAPNALSAPLAFLLGGFVAESAISVSVSHASAEMMRSPVRGG